MHAAVLCYLEAVAEEGSSRWASERLNISARRYSSSVRTASDWPRPAGSCCAIRARPSTTSGTCTAKSTTSQHRQQRGDPRHPGQPAPHFLPETLARFIAAYSAAQIRTAAADPNEIPHSMTRGSADLGLTFDPVWRGGIHESRNIPCPLRAIMTPNHDLAGRGSVTLVECPAYPLIYRDNSGSNQAFLADPGKRSSVRTSR